MKRNMRRMLIFSTEADADNAFPDNTNLCIFFAEVFYRYQKNEMEGGSGDYLSEDSLSGFEDEEEPTKPCQVCPSI
jgi:hypothetical protein